MANSFPSTADTDFGKRLVATAGYLYAIAYRLTDDRERARDLAQDSILIAWEKREQLREPSRLVPWARRICVNLFLQEERRSAESVTLSTEYLGELESEGRSVEIPDSGPLPAELAEVDESVREIRDACFAAMVERLTLHQRAVFALVETFGLSIGEAAESLDLSLSAAKALLSRARRHVIRYFDTTCSLMVRGNRCECLIWKNLINDRELMRAEARRRSLEADFGDERLPEHEGSRNRERILAMFRQLPPRRPDPAWFEQILARIGS
ncbi:MAG: RNA polymerase sigma factor [Treponema sp.]|nr:RNA polymerase sigma factor [Treponema sp.]